MKVALSDVECWPSVATIAERAPCCERTVRNALRRLERAGWIAIKPDTSNATGRRFVLLWRTERREAAAVPPPRHAVPPPPVARHAPDVKKGETKKKQQQPEGELLSSFAAPHGEEPLQAVEHRPQVEPLQAVEHRPQVELQAVEHRPQVELQAAAWDRTIADTAAFDPTWLPFVGRYRRNHPDRPHWIAAVLPNAEKVRKKDGFVTLGYLVNALDGMGPEGPVPPSRAPREQRTDRADETRREPEHLAAQRLIDQRDAWLLPYFEALAPDVRRQIENEAWEDEWVTGPVMHRSACLSIMQKYGYAPMRPPELGELAP